jgi:hypothetical protein
MPINNTAGSSALPLARDRSPVPHHNILYAEFQRIRARQAALHGRQMTDTNHQAARVIFETAVHAVMDVEQFDRAGRLPHYVMRVASLGTGTGKSTSAVALVAAYCRVHDDCLLPRHAFSAAFVLPTVQLAREMTAELQALMPQGERVAMWTREDSNTPRSELEDARVVVFCHQSWLNAMTAGRHDGFRFYRGSRRKLVFVDEQPELVKHLHVLPSALQGFYEDVQSWRDRQR